MAEIEKYLYKPIEKDKINFFKNIINSISIIYHSFFPHKLPVQPDKQLTVDSITDESEEIIYDNAIEIYKNSKERIIALESKAFNLTTYISALTALLIFLLDKELNLIAEILAFIGIGILLLALLLSLKCIGVKSQKTLFIDTLFEFNNTNEFPKSSNKKQISIGLINATLFNQNIADNTTDVLKASRSLLILGIISSVVTFFLYSVLPKVEKTEIYQIEISKSKYLDSIFINYNKDLINFRIDTKTNIDSLNKEIKSLKTELTNKKP